VPGERRYLLLVNPSAGGGRVDELLPRTRRAFEAAHLEHRLVLTEGLEHGGKVARDAAAAGEIVVVMSGDGLIGHVGGVLAGTRATLGVVPAGRGNDLARVLGLPLEVEAAVDLIAAGSVRAIDVGEVDGRRFLCIASCGFDSDANRIANEAQLVRGRLVYVYAALRALAAWRPATFTITTGGHRRTVTGYTVAVANGAAYGGGMYLAPEARLDDGMLDVVTVAQVSRLRFLANLPSVFSGRHTDNDEVETFRAEEVTVEADRAFAVYGDGDHLTDLPATFRVVPRSLLLIAPAPT
jgi:YegS/Rv2252/BmrU family lipid kinase